MNAGLVCWDVDTQVDFIEPNGALYTPGAEAIRANLGLLTRAAIDAGVPIIASMDAHLPGDPEFEEYPPHCMAGTPGQAKIPETRVPDAAVIPNRATSIPANLAKRPQIILEKQSLDVFTNPNADPVLEELGPRLDVILYGLVTELCVDRALRGLLERGHRVRLVTDAVRHLDEDEARQTLDLLVTSGGTLTTDEALSLIARR